MRSLTSFSKPSRPERRAFAAVLLAAILLTAIGGATGTANADPGPSLAAGSTTATTAHRAGTSALSDPPAPGTSAPSDPPAPGTSAPSDPPAPGTPAPSDPPEPLVLRQLEALQALMAGHSVEDVAALFSVSLVDEAAVRQRVDELDARLSRASRSPQSRDFDEKKQTLLRNWQATLSTLPTPSRQALEDLGRPKAAVRAAAEGLKALEPRLIGVADALARKIRTARSGGLAGFRTQLDAWAEEAARTEAPLRQTAVEVLSTAERVLREADRLEAQARRDRHAFLVEALRDDRPALDDQFIAIVARQRQLKALGTPTSLADVTEKTKAIVDQLEAVYGQIAGAEDISAATVALDRTNTSLIQVQRTLQLAAQLPVLFERADVRQAITLLLPTASSAARARAYPLGIEFIGELQAELSWLWADALAYWRTLWRRLASGAGLADWGPPGIAAAVLVLIGLFLQQRAGRLVSWLVRLLAKTSLFRGQVGRLVRIAGLLQAVAPVAVVTAFGYAVWAVLGPARAEVQFLEIAFRWTMIYWLGRSALLGSARRVSAGRPALIAASDETLRRLQQSYNLIGLVLAMGAIVEEWARTLLVLGTVRAAIEALVAAWSFGWMLYACFLWRVPVAQRLLRTVDEDSRWQSLARWMKANSAGALLVIPAGVRLLFGAMQWALSALLNAQGVFAYLKARSLRRQSEANEDAATERTLPERYRAEFPLYPQLGEVEGILLPRSAELDPIIEQFEGWRASRRESSLALIGEKGIGKTTLLSAVRLRVTGIEVSYCTLQERLLTPDDVVRVLAPLVGAPPGVELAELIEALNSGPERLIVIDDAHLSFLRTINGYRGFDALVQAVNRTGDRVFWILAFNDYAWSFLNAAHGGRAYFRRVFAMPRWTADELRDLIGRRTRKAGYELDFDASLLDDERLGVGDIRLVEGADGFFRLLWERSRGNPRTATIFWLNALRVAGPQRLGVRLFSTPRLDALHRASDDVRFAIAAIAQHENLDADELRLTLNATPNFVNFAVRYLTEYGIIAIKPGSERRFTLHMQPYWDVVEALHDKNLLYRETR